MSFSSSRQLAKIDDASGSKSSQQLSTQEKQNFDYTGLTPEIRVFVEGKTSEIKSLMRRGVKDIIEIGQSLNEVKKQLGHGNYRVWLIAEFDWSLRTAARFMQVATQFKSANLADLNIAVSALYLLAEPSTPQKARKHVLGLAKVGENMTHSKVKAIIQNYKKLTHSHNNVIKPANLNISARVREEYQPLQVCSHPKAKNKVDLATIEPSAETVAPKKLEPKLMHNFVERSNINNKKYLGTTDELKPEYSDYIRVTNIEYQNSDLIRNIPQTFEVNFGGVCVNFEGYPEALIILFEQMQNNPAFTKRVLQEAKY
ncbi:MAG: DUF3102 domain-containing protein [Cyanobacteria bacterium P01_D01_bin.50]